MSSLNLGGWDATLLGDEEDGPALSAHVAPINDTRQHILDHMGTCWCSPRLEFEEDSICPLYIHASEDGREDIETGRKRAN